MSQSDLIGHPFTEIIPVFHHPQFQEFLIKLLNGDSPAEITLHHKNKNGLLQPIRWVFQFDLLLSGKPAALIGSGNLVFQIDSLSNAEVNLNKLDKVALDSIQDVIIITDQGDNIKFFNQKFKELLQPEAQSSQLIDKDLHSVAPFLTSQYEQDKRAILQSVQNVTSETMLEVNDGIRFFRNYRIPVLENNDPYHLITIMQDITPLKLAEKALQDSEEKYRSFVQNFHGMVFRTDMNFVPIFINGSVTQITGYSSQILLSDSQIWNQIIHPEDQSWVNDARLRLRNEIGAVVELEYRITHKNGEIHWINELVQNTVDDQGNLRYIQGACYDITDRKKSEETLNQINQELHDTVKLLQLRNQQFMLLNEMGDMLQSSRQVEDAYAIVSDFAPLLFPGHSGAMYILDNVKHQYHSVASWGKNPPQTSSFQANECWAVRRGHLFSEFHPIENVLCCHAHNDLGTSLKESELSPPEDNPTGYVCVPMLSHGEIFGVMHLLLYGTFESEEITRLVQTIAERTALAVANLNLRNQLHTQSIRDPLTGLFNRRFMQETLEREIHKALRNNRGVSVAMIDIDRFKEYNDNYGHETGDSIIQQVGQYIQTHTRGEDVVCRFGGDEFFIILPEVAPNDAHRRIQELSEEISNLHIIFHGNQFENITISAGVSHLPDFTNNADELIRTADIALYQAKELGRNRVELFAPKVNSK